MLITRNRNNVIVFHYSMTIISIIIKYSDQLNRYCIFWRVMIIITMKYSRFASTREGG